MSLPGAANNRLSQTINLSNPPIVDLCPQLSRAADGRLSNT